eukprot:476573-Rhodomonas_salina.3
MTLPKVHHQTRETIRQQNLCHLFGARLLGRSARSIERLGRAVHVNHRGCGVRLSAASSQRLYEVCNAEFGVPTYSAFAYPSPQIDVFKDRGKKNGRKRFLLFNFQSRWHWQRLGPTSMTPRLFCWQNSWAPSNKNYRVHDI